MQERAFGTIAEAVVYGIGSGVGWFLAIVAIAAIRGKSAIQTFLLLCAVLGLPSSLLV